MIEELPYGRSVHVASVTANDEAEIVDRLDGAIVVCLAANVHFVKDRLRVRYAAFAEERPESRDAANGALTDEWGVEAVSQFDAVALEGDEYVVSVFMHYQCDIAFQFSREGRFSSGLGPQVEGNGGNKRPTVSQVVRDMLKRVIDDAAIYIDSGAPRSKYLLVSVDGVGAFVLLDEKCGGFEKCGYHIRPSG